LKTGQLFKTAFVQTIPVLAGYLFLGIAFGFLLQSKGFGFEWAGFMSITIFAGAMQFVAVTLLTEPFAPLSVFVITLMINARHIFYGFSMLEKYRGTGKFKPYLIFGMTDETFALLYSTEPPEGASRKLFYFYVTILDHIYWIVGGIIGATLGAVLPFDAYGIEFIMPALFTAIVVEQLRKKQNRIPCIIGLVASAICLVIFGPERFILPAMAVLVAALTLARKPLDKEETAA
jgi:Predicted branched-chain amino acid permease (azaleucine resistance)